MTESAVSTKHNPVSSIIYPSPAVEGTATAMAAAAASNTNANEGDRYIPSDGANADIPHSYRSVDGIWNFYPEAVVNSVGSIHVSNSAPGAVEYADVLFDIATDLPADPASVANILAGLIRVTGFTSGKKRCRISYVPLEDLGIPFAIGVRACVNSPDVTDASEKLAVVNNTGGDTISPIEGSVPQTACKQKSVIEWDLTGTAYDIDDVYLVGIAPDGTGASNVLVTIEVW